MILELFTFWIKSFILGTTLPHRRTQEDDTERNKSKGMDEGVWGSIRLETTAQLHSNNPELRFCKRSNTAHGLSEVRDGEALGQPYHKTIH